MPRHRSAIFARAVEAYHQCRAEYGDYLEGAFQMASDATSGNLLNERGRRRGIDAWTLFKGNETTALAYASEELVDYWRSHPRLTFEAFERDWPYDESQPI